MGDFKLVSQYQPQFPDKPIAAVWASFKAIHIFFEDGTETTLPKDNSESSNQEGSDSGVPEGLPGPSDS